MSDVNDPSSLIRLAAVVQTVRSLDERMLPRPMLVVTSALPKRELLTCGRSANFAMVAVDPARALEFVKMRSNCKGTKCCCLVAETILTSVHVRMRQQAGHMDASDLIRALAQTALPGGGRPHMDLGFGTTGAWIQGVIAAEDDMPPAAVAKDKCFR